MGLRIRSLFHAMLVVGALVLSACGDRPASQGPDEATERQQRVEVARARAISLAYANGDATTYRTLASQYLLQLREQSRDELVARSDALLSVAKQRGMAGMEGLVSSTIGALARRDREGARLAAVRLSQLKQSYRADKKLNRLNAHIAFVRPGSPAMYYVNAPVARAVLELQIAKGRPDLNQAIEQDLCTEAGLAAFALTWGQDRANQLRQLCAGIAGSGDALGGLGIGPAADISTVACIGNHAPTRAQRIEQLMQTCLLSMVEGSRDGNPWATDGVLQPTSSYREDGLYTRDVWRDEEDVSWLELTEYYEQPPPESGTPQNVGLVAETYYDRFGNITTKREYGGAFENRRLEVVQNFDADGNLQSAIAYDENGDRTESVDVTDDGGYIVTTYKPGASPGAPAVVDRQQRYDANGNPVNDDGTPATPPEGSPGMDWGETAECRAMSVGLLLERSEGEIQRLHGDPTVNPDPNAPGPETDELDCLGVGAGETLDASFQCRDEFKVCALGEVPDADCACQSIERGVAPQQLCGLFAVCTARQREERQGDACCGDVFEDINASPRPRPLPVFSQRTSRRDPMAAPRN